MVIDRFRSATVIAGEGLNVRVSLVAVQAPARRQNEPLHSSPLELADRTANAYDSSVPTFPKTELPTTAPPRLPRLSTFFFPLAANLLVTKQIQCAYDTRKPTPEA
jgi:hypothetical protein